MKSLRWMGLASMFAAAGCATAPTDHSIERVHTYSDAKDVIWERAVNFFAERNLSIKTIDKTSGLIAADRQISVTSSGIEGYADCGSAPLTRRVAQSIDLNLFIRALPSGSTSVTVNSRFTETRMLGYNGLTISIVQCVSTGKLEDSILKALNQGI